MTKYSKYNCTGKDHKMKRTGSSNIRNHGGMLLLLTCLLALLLGTCALAAPKPKYTALASGKWGKAAYNDKYKNAKTGEYTQVQYYTIQLSAPALLKFTVRTAGKPAGSISLYTTKSNLTKKKLAGVIKDQTVYALDEGTYYVRCDADCFRYSLTKAVFQTNFTPAKAVRLSAGKLLQVAQTREQFYERWYKIVLSKNQKITFRTNDISMLRLYDGELEEQPIANRAKAGLAKYMTAAALPRGTYYLCVSYRVDKVSGSKYFGGQYIKVTWN